MGDGQVRSLRKGAAVKGLLGAERKRKLSEVIAEQLMEDIKARGWPVGETIGTESQLMERFGVSRATIAEATRQVERHGAAVMRRGSGGGLVITSSAPTAAARAISTYLELSNVTVAEQYEAARVVETEAAKLAAARITEDQAAELRAACELVTEAEDNVELHRQAMKLRIAIADASGSPSLGLFMRGLARVITNYVRPDLRTQYRDRKFEHGIAADMSGIVEAIVAGDFSLAADYVRLDVERREQRARVLAVSTPLLKGGPLRRESATKLGEQVAFAIRDDITRMGWCVGERLGDEGDLPARYGVSQWVLRQAVRILEPHGIVRMRRGQGGGLFIGAPSPDYTVDAAISYFHSARLNESGAVRVRGRLFQSIAQFAAIRSMPEERAQLVALQPALVAGGAQAAQAQNEFFSLISTMSKNQVLSLFAAILNKVIEDGDVDGSSVGPPEVMLAISDAIISGDASMARRRIGKFLNAP